MPYSEYTVSAIHYVCRTESDSSSDACFELLGHVLQKI
jgi:hypothetical protein